MRMFKNEWNVFHTCVHIYLVARDVSIGHVQQDASGLWLANQFGAERLFASAEFAIQWVEDQYLEARADA